MNTIEQLLHDAMTEQTETVPHLRPGTARRSVARSRRTHRTRLAAASAATVAATAGVSALAINLQPGADSAAAAGAVSSSSAVAAPSVAAPSAAAVAASQAAPASVPAASASPQVDAQASAKEAFLEAESQAPAELKAVTLPGPIAGLTVMDSSYAHMDSGTWKKYFWFRLDGTEETSGSVIVTHGAAVPIWNQHASPSPAVSSVDVHGHAGTVWLSGGDREIYYTAGDLTVEVFVSDKNVTLAQMDKVADAVQGLPQ